MVEQIAGYNLKAVIRETGLNPETLRAWERRYGLPKPRRTPGGHRLYSLRDIQMLNWLSDRQKEGLSISRAVELWCSLEASGQDPFFAHRPEQQSSIEEGVIIDELREAWVNACMDFNEQSAERILSQAFAQYNPETVCIELLQKGISTVGQRWYQGETSVQQEHFASALAMRRLHTLAAALPPPNRSGSILAACPSGEDHEFGLLLVTILLRRRGWEVVYLGANVPLIKLEATLRVTSPFLVVSVCQSLPSAASLRSMGEFLRNQNVLLAYGGGIFNGLPSLKASLPGFFLGAEIMQVPQVVESLWNLKPAMPGALLVSKENLQVLRTYQARLPFIELEVKEALKSEDILPARLEIANNSLSQHLSAALDLGDIHLLEYSLKWLAGLLSNYGLSHELLLRFIEAYQSALGTQFSGRDMALFDWLAQFISDHKGDLAHNRTMT